MLIYLESRERTYLTLESIEMTEEVENRLKEAFLEVSQIFFLKKYSQKDLSLFCFFPFSR